LYSEIPTYHERLAPLTDQLRQHGHLALVLIDASELAQVEHDYGSRAFEQVLTTVSRFVDELHGTEIRSSDQLALNDRGGHAFLLFLSPRRGDQEGLPRIADLEQIVLKTEGLTPVLLRDVARIERPLEHQDGTAPAERAQRCSLGQIEQGETVGGAQRVECTLDAVAVGIGLDHRPDACIGGRGTRPRQVGGQRRGVDEGFDRARHVGTFCRAVTILTARNRVL